MEIDAARALNLQLAEGRAGGNIKCHADLSLHFPVAFSVYHSSSGIPVEHFSDC